MQIVVFLWYRCVLKKMNKNNNNNKKQYILTNCVMAWPFSELKNKERNVCFWQNTF